MNLTQLRFVREAVRQNFNLTEVANTLYISQPGVSKQIKELEDELGVELFERRGKRLTGLTEPGAQLIPVIERVLLDIRNMKKIAEQFAKQDHGHLTLATTHTQARYALPKALKAFKARFPDVHLALHQGSPQQIADLVARGEVDVGMSTEALEAHPDLVTVPAYSWEHCVIVPEGHPLAKLNTLTLEAIADYPVVTYERGFTGRARVDAAFASAGLDVDVVLTALDADVIKAYVEAGFGVGIAASMAFDEARDRNLVRIPAGQLFGHNTSRVAVRRGTYLRGFAIELIRLIAPEAKEHEIERLAQGARSEETI